MGEPYPFSISRRPSCPRSTLCDRHTCTPSWRRKGGVELARRARLLSRRSFPLMSATAMPALRIPAPLISASDPSRLLLRLEGQLEVGPWRRPLFGEPGEASELCPPLASALPFSALLFELGCGPGLSFSSPASFRLPVLAFLSDPLVGCGACVPVLGVVVEVVARRRLGNARSSARVRLSHDRFGGRGEEDK